MKTHLKTALLTLLFISASGACMSIPSLNPFKKEVVLMSPLKGTLLKNGKPLANVEIEVVITMPGEERTFKYTTNENGIFDLPVLKDTMTLGPMTEFVVSQYVYTIQNGEKKRFWAAAKREPELFAERQPPGETIGLSCDLLDEDKLYRNRTTGYIRTLCKWETIKEL